LALDSKKQDFTLQLAGFNKTSRGDEMADIYRSERYERKLVQVQVLSPAPEEMLKHGV
jgi:hypothetical protein